MGSASVGLEACGGLYVDLLARWGLHVRAGDCAHGRLQTLGRVWGAALTKGSMLQ